MLAICEIVPQARRCHLCPLKRARQDIVKYSSISVIFFTSHVTELDSFYLHQQKSSNSYPFIPYHTPLHTRGVFIHVLPTTTKHTIWTIMSYTLDSLLNSFYLIKFDQVQDATGMIKWGFHTCTSTSCPKVITCNYMFPRV